MSDLSGSGEIAAHDGPATPPAAADGWLGNKDSNLERRYQKPLCYHYTIPQQVRQP